MGLNDSTWNRYRNILLNRAHAQFNQDTLIWKRWTPNVVPEFNEDKEETYENINLNVLIGYNYYRTWPLTQHRTGGSLDEENMVALINVDYMVSAGYANTYKYLDFNPEKDKFVHRGILYTGQGDTFIAQAKDTPVLFQLILERQETNVGSDKYDQS